MKLMMMMRSYSTSILLPVLALALFGTTHISLVSAKPKTVDECPDKNGHVDFYEIQKIEQQDGNGPPPASLAGLEELEGVVYVELDAQQLAAGDPAIRFMEFYANVPPESNDCQADGTLIDLPDGAIVTNEWIEYDDYTQDGYCVPRTKNGVVVAIGFTFFNPLYTTPADMVIYDPLGGENNDGSIELCVRVGYLQNVDEPPFELITFHDTKITGIVDLTAEFSSFAVPIEVVEATEFDTEIVCKIGITTFLCGDPDEGNQDGRPRSDSYELGQNFRVCVDVEKEFQDDYTITDFTSVKCGNTQDERDLV